MTNTSVMKVESIAECVIGHENQFSVFLRVAVLHRFYCTHQGLHCLQETNTKLH